MAKNKKPTKTPEQYKAERLANNLSEVRQQIARYGNREPTVKFEIGEDVQIGNLDKTTVIESYDDGRIYKVHCFSVHDKNSQKAGEVQFNEERIKPWYDLEKITKVDNFSYKDDLHLNFSQRDIYGLIGVYYAFGVEMNPDYQRDLVWSLEDKVNLIDSIFNHVDIGKFVFVHLPYTDGGCSYEILDGKQRLSTIIEFFEGRFKYRGRTYQELSGVDKNFFTRTSISWAEISDRGQDRVSDETKYRYFLKLNTGGRPQDPKHIEYVRSLYKNLKNEKDKNNQ